MILSIRPFPVARHRGRVLKRTRLSCCDNRSAPDLGPKLLPRANDLAAAKRMTTCQRPKRAPEEGPVWGNRESAEGRGRAQSSRNQNGRLQANTKFRF